MILQAYSCLQAKDGNVGREMGCWSEFGDSNRQNQDPKTNHPRTFRVGVDALSINPNMTTISMSFFISCQWMLFLVWGLGFFQAPLG